MKIFKRLTIMFLSIFCLSVPAFCESKADALKGPEEYLKQQWMKGEVANFSKQFKLESERRVEADYIKTILSQIATRDRPDSAYTIIGAHIYGNLEIQDLKIIPALNFNKCYFFDNVSFEECNMLERISFAKSKFIGVTIFGECVFLEGIDFNGAIFLGSVLLDTNKFSEITLFSNARFLSRVNFFNNEFNGDTIFVRTNFEDAVIFSGGNSSELLFWGEVSFRGPVAFIEVQFLGKNTFQKVKFLQAVSFTGSKFSGPTTIFKGEFFKQAKFDKNIFKGTFGLLNSEFNEDVSFSETEFQKPVKILGTTFRQRAVFQNARFLDGGDFRKMDLTGVDFTESDLNGVDFRGSNLSNAKLYRANLLNANLGEAIFSQGTIIKDANLGGCYLNDVMNFPQCYEPKAGSPPYIPSVASFDNLTGLTFKKSPHGLIDLREGFRESGYREQERQITYALKHTHRLRLWNKPADNKDAARFYTLLWNKIESVFYLVFFEWTCSYGMQPGRPIRILFYLILFFSIPYAYFISNRGVDGIWRVWIKDRVRKDIGHDRPDRLYYKDLKAFKTGIYFSFLSAFSIGWKELNVGNWIARVQRREYVLKATGWARVVSGIQSIISVYLLALWALTYFGRPFNAL